MGIGGRMWSSAEENPIPGAWQKFVIFRDGRQAFWDDPEGWHHGDFFEEEFPDSEDDSDLGEGYQFTMPGEYNPDQKYIEASDFASHIKRTPDKEQLRRLREAFPDAEILSWGWNGVDVPLKQASVCKEAIVESTTNFNDRFVEGYNKFVIWNDDMYMWNMIDPMSSSAPHHADILRELMAEEDPSFWATGTVLVNEHGILARFTSSDEQIPQKLIETVGSMPGKKIFTNWGSGEKFQMEDSGNIEKMASVRKEGAAYSKFIFTLYPSGEYDIGEFPEGHEEATMNLEGWFMGWVENGEFHILPYEETHQSFTPEQVKAVKEIIQLAQQGEDLHSATLSVEGYDFKDDEFTGTVEEFLQWLDSEAKIASILSPVHKNSADLNYEPNEGGWIQPADNEVLFDYDLIFIIYDDGDYSTGEALSTHEQLVLEYHQDDVQGSIKGWVKGGKMNLVAFDESAPEPNSEQIESIVEIINKRNNAPNWSQTSKITSVNLEFPEVYFEGTTDEFLRWASGEDDDDDPYARYGSILSPVRKSLDEKIWDGDQLKPEVSEFCLGVVEDYLKNFMAEEEIPVHLRRVILIGSITGYQYDEDADLDVNILVDLDTLSDNLGLEKELLIYEMRHKIGEINGDLYPGTSHPVNLFLSTEEGYPPADGIYDMMTDEWIKKPGHPGNIDPYANLKDALDRAEEIAEKVDAKWGAAQRTKAEIDRYPQSKPQIIRQYIRYLRSLNRILENVVNERREIFDLARKQEIDPPQTSVPNVVYKYLEFNGLLDHLHEAAKTLKRYEETKSFDEPDTDIASKAPVSLTESLRDENKGTPHPIGKEALKTDSRVNMEENSGMIQDFEHTSEIHPTPQPRDNKFVINLDSGVGYFFYGALDHEDVLEMLGAGIGVGTDPQAGEKIIAGYVRVGDLHAYGDKDQLNTEDIAKIRNIVGNDVTIVYDDNQIYEPESSQVISKISSQELPDPFIVVVSPEGKATWGTRNEHGGHSKLIANVVLEETGQTIQNWEMDAYEGDKDAQSYIETLGEYARGEFEYQTRPEFLIPNGFFFYTYPEQIEPVISAFQNIPPETKFIWSAEDEDKEGTIQQFLDSVQ